MNVKEWVIEWFEKNSDQEKNEIEQNLHEDYLAKCWIDSLKFIELISEIEEHYIIKFSNNDFQDRSFSIGNGLVKAIEDKINEKQ
jgi:acyl carrier protein